MKTKLILLGCFTLTSFLMSGNIPLLESSGIIGIQHTSTSSFYDKEVKILLDDSSYKEGDRYTINIYHSGDLFYSKTIRSLSTMTSLPDNRMDDFVVEVLKYDEERRDFILIKQIIATEVFWQNNSVGAAYLVLSI